MVDLDDVESFDSKNCFQGESLSDCTDSELDDWRKWSILTPSRKRSASAFLNPSHNNRRSWWKNSRSFIKPNEGLELNYGKELSISSTEETAPREQEPPPFFEKSEGPKTSSTTSNPNQWNERTRTISGTPVIIGLYSALPDSYTFDSQPSPTPPPKNYDDGPSTTSLKLDSDWSEFEEEGGFANRLVQCLQVPTRQQAPSQSRRGSQLAPPREIWITGGPRPGLYSSSGKMHGRPMWVGEDVELRWNSYAKGWLLRFIDSNRNSALAILKSNSNNPCISTAKWRVCKGAHKGVSRSFSDSNAYRIDHKMACTKYYGCGRLTISRDSMMQELTIVKIKRGVGIVRFLGCLEDRSGTFAGIELFTPTGLNNGTRKGFFYFEAKTNHGVFVRYPHAVIEVLGPVTDLVATFIDDILITARRVREIPDPLIERFIRTMVLLKEGERLFCSSAINVLGIILFYELVMH